MGLVSVLVHDGIPFNHSCVYEYSAYSGIGWRTCIIPALCRAIGVKNVVEVNARDIQAVEKVVKEEIAKDEVSVIITKTPCVLLDKSKKPSYQTHTDKCKKCGMCMKPGCPAMTKNADGTISIDDTMCTGCGLCASLCKFDAIELVKEGDR